MDRGGREKNAAQTGVKTTLTPSFFRALLRYARFSIPFLAMLCISRLAAESGDTIAAQLQSSVDHHALAGAVTVVASKSQLLSGEAVGYADLAARKPMTMNTLFWIASMTKPITATALMMLVDEGKISVDDPVEKYLPEFRGQWLIAEQDGEHQLIRKPAH